MKARENENGIFAIDFTTPNGKERIVLFNSELKCVGIFRKLDLSSFKECEMSDMTDAQIIEQMGVYASQTKGFQRELSERNALEEQRKIETLRIQKIKERVAGLTPQEFADYSGIKSAETAIHWSDLYEGRSSFAFIIDNKEDYELLQIAISENDWDGEFGELCNRDGEHHHTFNSVYDLDDYRKNCKNYFSEKYFVISKETEEETYLEKIKECDLMSDILELTKEYEQIEEGYYSNGESLVCGLDFSDFWGYYYDVYSHSFGYKFQSKEIFYTGIEKEEIEDED
jgi:hypothetical protein